MKTISEIKSEMTDAILADDTLVSAMGLDTSRTWSAQTSVVSILNILLYIIAVTWYALQWLQEEFKSDVESIIDAALPGTISWYWNRAMEFQKGDAINEYGNYETIDEDKQVIKFCSVVEVAGGVMLKVNKADHAILSDDNDNELTAFVTYMNRIKFAGTNIYVYSYQPDTLDLSLTISRDALVMSTDGTLIAGDSTNVIAATISEYLNDIKYGGEFNKTKLIDAVQAVSGVDDVIITSATFTAYDASSTTTVLTQQNYTAISGHIELGTLTLTFDE